MPRSISPGPSPVTASGAEADAGDAVSKLTSELGATSATARSAAAGAAAASDPTATATATICLRA